MTTVPQSASNDTKPYVIASPSARYELSKEELERSWRKRNNSESNFSGRKTKSPKVAKSPKPSSSPQSPSATPTPYTIFIPKTIYVSREKIPSKGKHFDTTVNYPVEIFLRDLAGTDLAEVLNFEITEHPKNGTLDMQWRSIIFYPLQWFHGLDSFRYKMNFLDHDGTEHTLEKEAYVRVRVGVLLTKHLLTFPTAYNLSEIGSRTLQVQKQFDSEAYQNLIQEQDDWFGRRYNSCAIVGNGGSLKGSKRGNEIDSHEVVVRINTAAFLNYTEDVGSKISIAFANSALYKDCWRRKEPEAQNLTYETIAHIVIPMAWEKLPKCDMESKRHQPVIPMNYLFADLVDQILNEYHRIMFNGTEWKYRSTGMLAVTAMATVCDHISVYGFERGPNMENHYYGKPEAREWFGHSFNAEKAYFKELVEGKGLFEPFLETYDLYSTFSYIVD